MGSINFISEIDKLTNLTKNRIKINNKLPCSIISEERKYNNILVYCKLLRTRDLGKMSEENTHNEYKFLGHERPLGLE